MYILLTTLLGLWPGVISTGQAQNTSADQQTAVIPQFRGVNTGGVGQGPILVPQGYEVLVPYTSTPPVIDGVLGSEWTNAVSWDVSDTLGKGDGIPNPRGSVIAYAMWDDNFIYLAFDIIADNSAQPDNDEFLSFWDDDNSGTWASNSSEGQNDLLPGTTYRWASRVILPSGPQGWVYPRTDRDGFFAYSNASGHATMEMKIPIQNPESPFDPATITTSGAGDTVGIGIAYMDGGAGWATIACWPQNWNFSSDWWTGIASYGDLILLPKSNPYLVNVPYTSSPPTINGAINPSEWADAVVIDVSDTLAWDGVKNNPGDCLLYIKHDNNFLYLGYDAFKDLNMADHSQPSICLEDNASGDWPPPGNYSEGVNGIGTSNGWFAMSRFNDGGYYGWYNTGLTNYAFGNATGHVQCEFGIPIVNPGSDTKPENLGAGPSWPDTIRVFIYYYNDGEPGAWIAGWPQAPGDPDYDGWWYPTYFGTWILDPNADVSEGTTELPLALFAPSVVKGGFGINLSLPGESDVRLALYDATGRLVSVIAEGKLDAGNHTFSINPGSGGVYILRADVNGKTLSEKVTVVK